MEPVNEDWERAVAIVAHPDDLEYGAASAVARRDISGRCKAPDHEMNPAIEAQQLTRK